MGSFTIWHWMVVLIIVFMQILPVAKILSRIGWSRWLAILSVIPVVGWVFLWVVAYARWPKVDPVQPAQDSPPANSPPLCGDHVRRPVGVASASGPSRACTATDRARLFGQDVAGWTHTGILASC